MYIRHRDIRLNRAWRKQRGVRSETTSFHSEVRASSARGLAVRGHLAQNLQDRLIAKRRAGRIPKVESMVVLNYLNVRYSLLKLGVQQPHVLSRNCLRLGTTQ